MAAIKGMCEALAKNVRELLQQHPRCGRTGVRAKWAVDPRFLDNRQSLHELSLGRAEEGDDFGMGYDLTVETMWHGHRQREGVFIPKAVVAKGITKQFLVRTVTAVILRLNDKEVLRQREDEGLMN